MFAVTEAGPLRHTAACCYALLCVLCHIPFVVVLLDGSSSNTSALGKPLISAECLLDCGPWLQINGPFFHAPDTGPVTLLKARNANYELKMIKMLPNSPSNIQLGGSEAIACRAILPSAERQSIPIIRDSHLSDCATRTSHLDRTLPWSVRSCIDAPIPWINRDANSSS